MSSSWTDILASADEETIGEALIRLARRAADMHRDALAGQQAETDPDDGFAGLSVVPPRRAADTEVGR